MIMIKYYFMMLCETVNTICNNIILDVSYYIRWVKRKGGGGLTILEC